MPALDAVATMAQSRRATVGVVTVTYNSGRFFDEYMSAIQAQTRRPDTVVIVDSGSTEAEFLLRAASDAVTLEVKRESNVGVCVGNNIGWRSVKDHDYILFLNPDAFLAPDFIGKAVDYMEENPQVGMVTPSLIRYDIERHEPLNAIDTTGVVRNWHGFSERDQSKPIEELVRYKEPNRIPWLCSAVVMCRREAINAVVEPGDQLFDESFFMYKDDTDVSWRVRRAGWEIIHHPSLLGYHCRGWQSRKSMSRDARILSSRNEIKMCWKNRSPFLMVPLAKYVAVQLFDL